MQTSQTYYLAPVRGITDLVYRNCFADQFKGVDLAMAPFVQTVKGNQIKASHLLENTPAQNRLPTIPQIIGRNPGHFIDLARQLADAGNTAVNWNLGCPYPTMTKKRCGSGLLPYPQDIDKFLETVCAEVPLAISIKMRLGLETPQDILTLLPILNRYPIEHVTIHPRLGTQMYGGDLDLDCFGLCLETLNPPVIYNGDITTLEAYHTLKQRFPQVTTWMLGRGLLANPCLIEEIQQGDPLPLSDKITRIRAFHAALLEGYSQRLSGPAHQIQRMVSHWEYLRVGLPFGEKLFHKVRKARTLADYHTAIGQTFGSGA
ncbi:MAG: tRNA-dihydrouridine synthase family protein [Phycisphaerae bacterium]|nr:tRNA-dihydrouridine synthase family protein [Phycisphaerae bacterium]